MDEYADKPPKSYRGLSHLKAKKESKIRGLHSHTHAQGVLHQAHWEVNGCPIYSDA